MSRSQLHLLVRCLPISPNPRVRVGVRVGVMARLELGLGLGSRLGLWLGLELGLGLGLGLGWGVRIRVRVRVTSCITSSRVKHVSNKFVHVRRIGIRRNGAEPLVLNISAGSEVHPSLHTDFHKVCVHV